MDNLLEATVGCTHSHGMRTRRHLDTILHEKSAPRLPYRKDGRAGAVPCPSVPAAAYTLIGKSKDETANSAGFLLTNLQNRCMIGGSQGKGVRQHIRCMCRRAPCLFGIKR